MGALRRVASEAHTNALFVRLTTYASRLIRLGICNRVGPGLGRSCPSHGRLLRQSELIYPSKVRIYLLGARDESQE